MYKKITEELFLAIENLSNLLEIIKNIKHNDLEVFIEFSDMFPIELKIQGPHGYDELTFGIYDDRFVVEEDSYIDDPDKYKDMRDFVSLGEALEWFINWQKIREYYHEQQYGQYVIINDYYYGV